MKESIIAKLSKHADDLFSDVLKNMQKESVRSLWDKDWVPVVSGKFRKDGQGGDIGVGL